MVRARLAGLREGGHAELLISRPRPTAAFSRRDALLPAYGPARAVVAARGFAPVLRPVGGHLAVYDEGALTLHLLAPHADPRSDIRGRFEAFGETMTETLRAGGVDARVGAVPGEYCDGAYSVNLAGRSKLVGTGQRIVRGGYLFSAVVMIDHPGPARAAMREAYRALGMAFDPASVGCLDDALPGITWEGGRDLVVDTLAPLVSICQRR